MTAEPRRYRRTEGRGMMSVDEKSLGHQRSIAPNGTGGGWIRGRVCSCFGPVAQLKISSGTAGLAAVDGGT